MKKKILEFLKSNQSKAFAWQTANGFIVFIIGMAVYIQPDVINPTWALVLAAFIAGLNALTKFINLTYLTKK